MPGSVDVHVKSDPASCRELADWLRRLGTRHREASDAALKSASDSEAIWHGRAADAFRRHQQRAGKDVDDLVDAIEWLARGRGRLRRRAARGRAEPAGAVTSMPVSEHFRVHGGARLVGEVDVVGAKNSVLKLMAAALLAEGTTTITNCPEILDVPLMADVLRSAVAETKHYARVRVQKPPELALHGDAVADAVHLVAELLDNATSFSP